MECPGGEATTPEAALQLFQARYALPVVRALLDGPLRFTALQQRTAAASATTLHARLRDLQDAGVILHHEERYALTATGHELRGVFAALVRFHEQHPQHDPALLLTALQRRYAMRIMRELMAGALGFNALQRRVDAASPTTLRRRLVDLEQMGLIDRTAHSLMPPRTTYAHSDVGRDFSPVVGQLVVWSPLLAAPPAAPHGEDHAPLLEHAT